MFIKTSQFILSAFIAVVLTSCGGGGGTQIAEGGIGGSGIAKGTISGFGSIYVNGVKYDTINSSYTSNRVIKQDQSHLKIGMVVTVVGKINGDGLTGTAKSVDYKILIDAAILNQTSTSFTALGQTIYHDQSVSLIDGERYAVSGYYDDKGNIHASYIVSSNSQFSSVRGKINKILPNGSFEIGALTISANTGISIAGINVGDFVEVKGFYDGFGLLSVNEDVKIEMAGLSLEDSDEAQLEGYLLTSCTLPLPCNISLNGQQVSISNSTTFGAGNENYLLAGTKIEVEGELINSILIADEVEFKDEFEIEVEVLESNIVNGITGTKILSPTGFINFEIIIVDADTKFKTGSFADLTSGNTNTHFSINGKIVNGKLLASNVEKGSAPDIKITGAVDSFVLNTSITVAGQIIVTAGIQIKVDDNSVNGKNLTEIELYDYLSKNNSNIEVVGELSAGNILWSEIKLN